MIQFFLFKHSNETARVEEEEDMNISQEILVLDFGDEKNHDFLRSDPSADFGKGNIVMSCFYGISISYIFLLTFYR